MVLTLPAVLAHAMLAGPMLSRSAALAMGLGLVLRRVVGRRGRGMMFSAATTTVLALVVVIGQQGPDHERRRGGEEKDEAFHPNLERGASGLALIMGSIIDPCLRPCQAPRARMGASRINEPHPKNAQDWARFQSILLHYDTVLQI
jgi:hypothetical protein